MTIAACYLSHEGVVLGADSTSTVMLPSANGHIPHYYNHGQKIFEVGTDSTIGMASWGLGTLGSVSKRTAFAQFGDALGVPVGLTGQQVVDRWIDFGWAIYETAFADQLKEAAWLMQNPKSSWTPDELRRGQALWEFAVGFCIGGRCPPDRTPWAFEVTFDPFSGKPSANALVHDYPRFWGAPSMVNRLLFGVDEQLLGTIQDSSLWTGSFDDLINLARPFFLDPSARLPIREAIDYIHSAIMITIQAMKFLDPYQICGGPIEVAAITTDRPFRWVTHKQLDSAICGRG